MSHNASGKGKEVHTRSPSLRQPPARNRRQTTRQIDDQAESASLGLPYTEEDWAAWWEEMRRAASQQPQGQHPVWKVFPPLERFPPELLLMIMEAALPEAHVFHIRYVNVNSALDMGDPVEVQERANEHILPGWVIQSPYRPTGSLLKILTPLAKLDAFKYLRDLCRQYHKTRQELRAVHGFYVDSDGNEDGADEFDEASEDDEDEDSEGSGEDPQCEDYGDEDSEGSGEDPQGEDYRDEADDSGDSKQVVEVDKVDKGYVSHDSYDVNKSVNSDDPYRTDDEDDASAAGDDPKDLLNDTWIDYTRDIFYMDPTTWRELCDHCDENEHGDQLLDITRYHSNELPKIQHLALNVQCLQFEIEHDVPSHWHFDDPEGRNKLLIEFLYRVCCSFSLERLWLVIDGRPELGTGSYRIVEPTSEHEDSFQEGGRKWYMNGWQGVIDEYEATYPKLFAKVRNKEIPIRTKICVGLLMSDASMEYPMERRWDYHRATCHIQPIEESVAYSLMALANNEHNSGEDAEDERSDEQVLEQHLGETNEEQDSNGDDSDAGDETGAESEDVILYSDADQVEDEHSGNSEPELETAISEVEDEGDEHVIPTPRPLARSTKKLRILWDGTNLGSRDSDLSDERRNDSDADSDDSMGSGTHL